jgi:hypothetical protein
LSYGFRLPDRRRHWRQIGFGRRFRAGIEGRISVLFRGHGMKRCLAEGIERFELLVGDCAGPRRQSDEDARSQADQAERQQQGVPSRLEAGYQSFCREVDGKRRAATHQHTEHTEMADPRLPASTGNVKFQVYVKVEAKETEDFKVAFEFGGEPEEGILVHCNRDLSEAAEQQLKNLATKFVSRIVFKVQLAQDHNRPTWWRSDEQG